MQLTKASSVLNYVEGGGRESQEISGEAAAIGVTGVL